MLKIFKLMTVILLNLQLKSYSCITCALNISCKVEFVRLSCKHCTAPFNQYHHNFSEANYCEHRMEYFVGYDRVINFTIITVLIL